MRGSRENRPGITLEDGQPIRKVGGMILAGLKSEFKIGAEESGAQLRNEFLLRIGVAAEAVPAEVAVKTVLTAAPMGQFMASVE